MASRPAAGLATAARPPQLTPVDGLAQLSFVIHGMLEQRADEHDLSMIQTRLLGVLRDRRPTMNELARLLGLDKSSVTGLVDRAERRSLVTRVPSATDRRAVLVSLTDDGRSLVSQAAMSFEADVSGLLDRLPPRDQATLSRLISRLLVAHAADQGIDLFPADGPDEESVGQESAAAVPDTRLARGDDPPEPPAAELRPARQ
jgi:MarR family transcriptional regulator, lower aerobic nicotinate degradation pathway regulator